MYSIFLYMFTYMCIQPHPSSLSAANTHTHTHTDVCIHQSVLGPISTHEPSGHSFLSREEFLNTCTCTYKFVFEWLCNVRRTDCVTLISVNAYAKGHVIHMWRKTIKTDSLRTYNATME